MQSLGVIAVFGIGRNVSDPVFGCSHMATLKSLEIIFVRLTTSSGGRLLYL